MWISKKACFVKNLLLLPIIYAFGVELLPFLTQKRTKKIEGAGGSNRGIEGSPLWIVCGKNCRRKIFWIFQKEIPKMAYPGPF